MKRITGCLLAAMMLLMLISGCGSQEAATAKEGVTVLATTYPMYEMVEKLLSGVEGVTAEAMISEQVSCLHDYTLTTTQMKAMERADLVVLSGAGLEDFMASALKGVPAEKLVDSSEGVELLEDDPHIWMDPERYARQGENIAAALKTLLPDSADTIEQNLMAYTAELLVAKESMQAELSGLQNRGIVTFHDGFSYFADAFDLEILAALEEEEGAEPSAAEIKEVADIVAKNGLPAIFTEINGATNAAEIVAEETGVKTYALSMIMSDQGTDYLTALHENIETVKAAME